MPYVAIKSFPKDEATKKEAVKRINEVFLDVWGCPQEAITISIEEVAPSDWEENVYKKEIEQNKDKMLILKGKMQY